MAAQLHTPLTPHTEPSAAPAAPRLLLLRLCPACGGLARMQPSIHQPTRHFCQPQSKPFLLVGCCAGAISERGISVKCAQMWGCSTCVHERKSRQDRAHPNFQCEA